ncbi:MAG: hypothetical protein JXB04_07790 [Kiritimatiellae bacterium]|nr:hypothetical protein [Kiritimatiellia bacterium]
MLSSILAVGLAATAHVAQFDLGGAVNKDVIQEASATGSTAPFGGNPVAVAAYVEDGYADGELRANGLPSNRIVTSPSGLGEYLLRPYGGKNVIELESAQYAPAKSLTIRVPPGRYARIGMLVAAVDGDASFSIKINYADSTSDTGWWEADDWYGMGPRGNQALAVGDMDLVNVKTKKIDDANVFGLYEYVYTGIDTNKVIHSIAIGNDPHRWPDFEQRYGGVFAINGERVAVPAEQPRKE